MEKKDDHRYRQQLRKKNGCLIILAPDERKSTLEQKIFDPQKSTGKGIIKVKRKAG